jgi:hypothetical protein
MSYKINTSFSISILSEPSVQSRLARTALITLLLAGFSCMVISASSVLRLIALIRITGQAVTYRPAPSVNSAIGTTARVAKGQADANDFVLELPVVSPGDLQIRYAARLAREQGASVLQMQSEVLKTDPKALGQSRITLQLRGDYRDIKNVWVALLAKYPGLTLQRLTLRHHTEMQSVPSPQAAAVTLRSVDRADDEATIEMIQYTQPPAIAR